MHCRSGLILLQLVRPFKPYLLKGQGKLLDSEFTDEPADLNRTLAARRRGDKKCSYQAAFAVSIRLDVANRFAARCAIKAYTNAICRFSLVTEDIMTRLQVYVTDF